MFFRKYEYDRCKYKSNVCFPSAEKRESRAGYERVYDSHGSQIPVRCYSTADHQRVNVNCISLRVGVGR